MSFYSDTEGKCELSWLDIKTVETVGNQRALRNAIFNY